MSEGTLYLLDTNVISEIGKKRPEERVLKFLEPLPSSALYLSVLTLGELRKGVAMKRGSDLAGARLLEGWVDGLEDSYSERILKIDVSVARLWGELSVARSLPAVDTLLVATAMHHGLTLVTRNVKDVSGTAVKIINPWGSGSIHTLR